MKRKPDENTKLCEMIGEVIEKTASALRAQADLEMDVMKESCELYAYYKEQSRECKANSDVALILGALVKPEIFRDANSDAEDERKLQLAQNMIGQAGFSKDELHRILELLRKRVQNNYIFDQLSSAIQQLDAIYMELNGGRHYYSRRRLMEEEEELEYE